MRPDSVRSAPALVALAACVLGLAGPAALAAPVDSAAATARSSVARGGSAGWEPVPAPPFVLPAGEVCSFEVAGEFPVNEQRAFVLRGPDGEKRFEYITGRLVGVFTNTSSGETVERDLSGIGAITYRPDGGFRLAVVGAALIGFHPGDDPANILEVNGQRSAVVVAFTADGQRTRLVQGGPYEDLCVTLA